MGRKRAIGIPRSSTPENAVMIGDTLEEFCGDSEVYYVDTDSADEYDNEEYEEEEGIYLTNISTYLTQMNILVYIIDKIWYVNVVLCYKIIVIHNFYQKSKI